MKRLLAMVCAALVSCSGEAADPKTSDAAKPGLLIIHATSYPLAFFAERVGGHAVEVVLPVPVGVDPAHWNPDPETIAQAQQADVLLRSGAGDPAWLDLASLHRDRVVDTTAHVRDRLLERQTAAHQHGPEGEHSHGAWSSTPWLDPTLAAAQAEAVTDALVARRPEDAEIFRSNVATLTRELEQLDRALADAARKLGGAPLLFSHPVYAYLQARYALNGRSVAWEPNEMPREAEWRGLPRLLEEHPARTMLWEAEPESEISERLAALGVQSRVYDPCSSRPDSGDWSTVMRANLRALEAVAGDSR